VNSIDEFNLTLYPQSVLFPTSTPPVPQHIIWQSGGLFPITVRLGRTQADPCVATLCLMRRMLRIPGAARSLQSSLGNGWRQRAVGSSRGFAKRRISETDEA
jgi:hypothetical protein